MSATPPTWLERLSLASLDGRAETALAQSRLLGGPVKVGDFLHAKLAGWIAGSAIAPHAETLSLGAVCLVFLASPFVGTGLNAGFVLLAFALTLLRWFLLPETRARFSSLDLCVVAYIALHLVSTGFSAFLLPSLKGLAKMVIYWLAYFSFRQNLQSRKALGWVFMSLLLAGSLEALYGVYQWKIGVEPLAAWEDPEALNPVTRVYSTLMNPNLLAAYLLPIFPIAVVGTVVWRNAARYLAMLAAVSTALCIWFTYSRGAMIGLAASLAVFAAMLLSLGWPTLKQSKKLQGLVALGAAGLIALVGLRIATSPAMQERIASIFTLHGDSSNSFRMNVWTGVFHMLHDYWPIGIGVGNAAFRKVYPLYMVSGFEALGAYNIFLEAFVELGILGLVVFVWMWLAFAARNLYTFWAGTGQNRWWSAAVIAGLVATIAMGMFDTVYYRPAVQLQFWLLLAVTICLSPRQQADTAPPADA